jgi:hypothetical protein
VNTFSTWLTVFMLALFTVMVGIAFGFPEGARFMPLIVGIPAIALCLLQLAIDAAHAPGWRFATYRFRPAPKAGTPPEEAAAGGDEFGPETVPAELAMFGYFLAFIAGVLLFGFYVSVPVMLVTFLRRRAGASARLALTLGAAMTVVMYVMFGLVLRITLHPGFLTPAILNALGL